MDVFAMVFARAPTWRAKGVLREKLSLAAKLPCNSQRRNQRSGERTLAACWSPHSAATNFSQFEAEREGSRNHKVRDRRMRSPARQRRALPGIPRLAAYADSVTLIASWQ